MRILILSASVAIFEKLPFKPLPFCEKALEIYSLWVIEKKPLLVFDLQPKLLAYVNLTVVLQLQEVSDPITIEMLGQNQMYYMCSWYFGSFFYRFMFNAFGRFG